MSKKSPKKSKKSPEKEKLYAFFREDCRRFLSELGDSFMYRLPSCRCRVEFQRRHPTKGIVMNLQLRQATTLDDVKRAWPRICLFRDFLAAYQGAEDFGVRRVEHAWLAHERGESYGAIAKRVNEKIRQHAALLIELNVDALPSHHRETLQSQLSVILKTWRIRETKAEGTPPATWGMETSKVVDVFRNDPTYTPCSSESVRERIREWASSHRMRRMTLEAHPAFPGDLKLIVTCIPSPRARRARSLRKQAPRSRVARS